MGHNRAVKRLSVHEAKAHFSAVLNSAESGETTIITKHGKPIAEIRPVAERKGPVFGAFADSGIKFDEATFEWTDEELTELFGDLLDPLPEDK